MCDCLGADLHMGDLVHLEKACTFKEGVGFLYRLFLILNNFLYLGFLVNHDPGLKLPGQVEQFFINFSQIVQEILLFQRFQILFTNNQLR